MTAMNLTNKLPNGAYILAIDYVAGVVLASTGRDYVTWQFGGNDLASTYWGHYFGNDILEAKADYKKRCDDQTGYGTLVK